MCGRYELSSHPTVIALAFGLAHAPDLRPRYNIAPTQQVPVVRIDSTGRRELVQLRWGLIPRWAKDPSIGSHMINARAETVADKAAFRIPYARHRCLLPASGFYEWQALPSHKQPVHIGLADGRPFAMAGLYERWRSPEDRVIDTCAIVTTRASDALRAIHERMPVIIAESGHARWLDVANPDVADLLEPWSGEPLLAYPVSTRVNAVANDDPTLREPLQPPLL